MKKGIKAVVIFLTAILFILLGIALYRMFSDYNSGSSASISNEEYTEKINTLKKEINTAEEELDSLHSQLSEFEVESVNGYVYGRFYDIDLFREAAKKYDMDYRLPYAIAAKECGFSSSAYLYDNNPGGIMNNGGLAVFDSKVEGIEFMCKMIYEVYVVNGVDTPALMQSYYCPGSDTWAGEIQATIDILEPDED